MKYISTRGGDNLKFLEAVVMGMAPNGGLYVPQYIPKLENDFWDKIKTQSFRETAYDILSKFIDEDEIDLNKIIRSAFNFPVEMNKLDEHIAVLELFHGHSNAFKDFGARFLAAVLSEYAIKNDIEITILVATSGDTGSAVGKAFYNAKNINVKLLYPSGKVSEIQEKQLTTIGGNVTAVEVNGTFDDCQRLVKTAFADDELREKINLSSANSINIARLLPQALYYFEIYKYFDSTDDLILSVPSGNLGNLTGALIANKMGLPISTIVSALNANDVFHQYVATGKYEPRNAIPTISNAMDVGAPNNLERIVHLFNEDLESLRGVIKTTSITDEETLETIKLIYNKYNYVVCPHTAVAAASLFKIYPEILDSGKAVISSTAHPAKFLDIYDENIKSNIQIPEQLQEAINKTKQSIPISREYEEFRVFLLNNN